MKRRTVRRAFTLLELLLASATLASIALLGTALWSQSASASESAQQRDRGLQLQRIGTMMRSQWSHRRVLRPVEDGSGVVNGVTISTTGIEFVTADAVLWPDEPLVVARYEWDSRDGAIDIRYLERPVRSFGAVADEVSPDDAARTVSRQIVLLEQCDGIGVERFGEAPPDGAGRAEENDKSAWWGYDSTEPIESDALRVSVQWRGEEAVWVFVARPSR